MKKLKLIFLLAGLLSMWQVRAQVPLGGYTGTLAPITTSVPATFVTIPNGNQIVSNQTLTVNNTWYKWTNTNLGFYLEINPIEQGVQYKLNKVELYVFNGTNLTLIAKDTIDATNKLLIANNTIAANSSVYINVTSIQTCVGCTGFAYPIYTTKVLNVVPGCSYVQPDCEYIVDGGFENFNMPCSTLQITNPMIGFYYPSCYWSPAFFGSGTPDYFNSCATTYVSQTNSQYNYFNNYLYMTTHSGDGYSGFYAYEHVYSPLTGWSNNYREYNSQALTTALTIGNSYTLKMWVRLSDMSEKYVNELHAVLSTGGPCWSTLAPGDLKIPLTPSVGVLNNKTSWIPLSVTFTATSAFTHILIGNYNDDVTTTIGLAPPTSAISMDMAYYFIDDISLRPTSSFTVASQDISLCLGSTQTVTLTALPPLSGSTYSWTSLPVTTSLSTISVSSVVVTPTITTSYSVVASPGGCSNSAVANVNVYPTMQMPYFVPSTNTICQTELFEIGLCSADFTVSATSFTLLPTGGTNTLCPYFSGVTAYTTGLNTYTVLGTNSSGCIASQTLSVFVIPPITTNTNNISICLGSTASFTASGALSYIWSNGATTPSISVSPTVNTTYTVTGYNSLGCSSTQTVLVSIKPSTPTLGASPNQSICPGDSRTLTASGAASYTWQPGGVVSYSMNVTPSVTTVYTVTGTGVCGGVASRTVMVTIKPVATIAITSTLSNLCAAASTGSNTVFNYTISPSGTTLTWIVKNAVTGATLSVPITSGASSASINLASYINYTTNINFIATVTGTNGCSSSQTITLFACCTTSAGVTKYTNTLFTTSTAFTSAPIILSGTINVNSVTLTFNGTNVYIDPNTKIILNGTGAINAKTSYWHGCTAMWDGIYAIGSTSNNIQIDACRIEDAKRAIIDSIGKAKLTITNSYFNKNQIGVVMKGTKPIASAPLIKGNLFTCSTISVTPTTWFSVLPLLTNSAVIGAFPSTSMLPPYSTYNSMCGIHLVGAMQAGVTNSVITIGVSTPTNGNIYDKMKAGIVNFNSNINVQKSVFQNITTAMNNPSFSYNAGIVIQNSTAASLYNNIGGSVANSNTFFNNEYGVYNLGCTKLYVSYNKFDNQTIGVLVTGNSCNLRASVNNNNFYKTKIGIDFYNNAPKINATIADNNIDNSSATVGAFNTNYAIVCGEAVAPTSAANTTTYTVSNNNIKNYYNGIWSAQTLSTTINDNEVHMAQDNANDHWQRGIHVENSNTPKVNNNIVDIPSLNQWAYWQLGIDMGSNQVPRVQCNSVTNLCMGLAFSGANITTPGDGIIGNYLQNNAYGFWLLNNGEIGNQFKTVLTTTLSADNAWAGYTLAPPSAYYTFAQGSSNLLSSGTSSLYTRSSGIYNLPTTLYGKDLPSAYLKGTNSSAASSGTCNIATPTPTNVRLGGGAVNKLRQNGEDDADDYNLNGANMGRSAIVNLTEADDINTNAISKRAINHYQLYRSVKLQGIDVTGSPAMLGFMNGAKTDNVGLFFAVDSLLHNAETDSIYIPSARYLNNSIIVKNKVDKTHKAFNELYASYLSQRNTLKLTEISSLEDIAYLCPAIYGNAVYQARAVLFAIKKQSYMSDCEKVSPVKSSKKIANSLGDITEIVVYPNPANSELFVNAIGYNEVTIKLYNIMGELVLEKVIAPNQSLNISNLVNGIYTYKIYSSNNELKTDKLIIIK